jgi:hypothetical protein
MSGQRFAARERFTFDNGAIGWRPGGPFDCLGPYAKVEHCPIDGTALRRTCYATGYADTFFSIPAVCTVRGKRIKGYFSSAKDADGLDAPGLAFYPMDSHKHLLEGAK